MKDKCCELDAFAASLALNLALMWWASVMSRSKTLKELKYAPAGFKVKVIV
jgi:hypothetical protein